MSVESNIRVAIVSSNPQYDAVARAQAQDAAFLTKPITKAALAQLLNAATDQGRPGRSR
jgi:CheY-like chemotaxis protein